MQAAIDDDELDSTGTTIDSLHTMTTTLTVQRTSSSTAKPDEAAVDDDARRERGGSSRGRRTEESARAASDAEQRDDQPAASSCSAHEQRWKAEAASLPLTSFSAPTSERRSKRSWRDSQSRPSRKALGERWKQLTAEQKHAVPTHSSDRQSSLRRYSCSCNNSSTTRRASTTHSQPPRLWSIR